MLISIQQPEFFPWIGYFHKLMNVDKVVFLDSVQFKKRYFENRNKIRTPNGWCWIRTPVQTKGRYNQNINDVLIDNSIKWKHKLCQTIESNYKKAPFWKDLGDDLLSIVICSHSRLSNLNLKIIIYLMERLNIKIDWCLSSSLLTKGKGSDLIIEICQILSAKQYLSGINGKQYLFENDFKANKIGLRYQNFTHPRYKQFHGDFIPYMSVIDLIFNYGEDARAIILDS